MQIIKSLIYMVLVGGVVFALSACGDKQDDAHKEAVPGTEGQKMTQNANQKELNMAACNTYFEQMQACVSSRIAKQDQQLLETSLSFLKQQIEKLDDQEQIAKICQKSLDTIDEQKKKIGCV